MNRLEGVSQTRTEPVPWNQIEVGKLRAAVSVFDHLAPYVHVANSGQRSGQEQASTLSGYIQTQLDEAHPENTGVGENKGVSRRHQYTAALVVLDEVQNRPEEMASLGVTHQFLSEMERLAQVTLKALDTAALALSDRGSSRLRRPQVTARSRRF